MPNWLVAEREYDLPRDIALLDTNVLISAVDSRDDWHNHTLTLLDLGQFRWAVSHASLVEAWNLLAGREKRKDLAYKLMQWVLTPGEVILVGDAIEPVSAAHEYSSRFQIDLVDAGLLDLADRMSRECDINPAVHVATYDTADFLRLFGPSGLSFNIYDMEGIYSTAER